jgi:leader peptidase (prepilin peptidase)/N-methyltransferase
MTELFIFYACMAGAVLGSFFNMLIHRIPLKGDIVFKPSHCPKCEHRLGIIDLIPILSYLFRLAKCGYCKKPISPRYFIVEILSVANVALCWMAFGMSGLFFKTTLFISCLIILFFIDLEHFLLPDVITLPLIAIGLIWGAIDGNIKDVALGSVVGFSVYFIIAFLAKLYYKKDALGGGDMKLGAAIGAFWGLKMALLSIYFSFLFGGAFGIALIVMKKRKLADHLAFGPAMILAFLFAFIWGEKIVKAYLGFV